MLFLSRSKSISIYIYIYINTSFTHIYTYVYVWLFSILTFIYILWHRHLVHIFGSKCWSTSKSMCGPHSETSQRCGCFWFSGSRGTFRENLRKSCFLTESHNSLNQIFRALRVSRAPGLGLTLPRTFSPPSAGFASKRLMQPTQVF